MDNEKAALIAKELEEGTEAFHLNEKNLIYQVFRDRFGSEVDEIIENTIGKRAQKAWSKVAAIIGDNSLESFLKCQFGALPDMGWEFTREDKDGEVRFTITKCPKYDFAKALGAEKLMYLLACATDIYNVRGFNPKIGFKRTKTLMEGHDCCDHCYFMQ